MYKRDAEYEITLTRNLITKTKYYYKYLIQLYQTIILLLFAISAWHPHEILRMRMRMRMSKFMRISADADPDAELRYTSSIYYIHNNIDSVPSRSPPGMEHLPLNVAK